MESAESAAPKLEIISQPHVIRVPYVDEYKREASEDFFGKPVERYAVKALVKNPYDGSSKEEQLGYMDVHFLHMSSFDDREHLIVAYIGWVYIEDEWRGQNLGSMLVRSIEQRILDEGMIGILKDEIGFGLGGEKDWQSAKKRLGMYKRHGWESIRDNSSKLVFNREIINPKVTEDGLYLYTDGVVDSYVTHERRGRF